MGRGGGPGRRERVQLVALVRAREFLHNDHETKEDRPDAHHAYGDRYGFSGHCRLHSSVAKQSVLLRARSRSRPTSTAHRPRGRRGWPSPVGKRQPAPVTRYGASGTDREEVTDQCTASPSLGRVRCNSSIVSMIRIHIHNMTDGIIPRTPRWRCVNLAGGASGIPRPGWRNQGV